MGQTNAKYEAKTFKELEEKIKKYGICYISDVLTNYEIAETQSGIWDYFEKTTEYDDDKILLSDHKTWVNIELLNPEKDTIYKNFGAGHCNCLWDLRQNETVLKIWSVLLNCHVDDLLVSFEGFSFLRPPEHTNENWQSKNKIFTNTENNAYTSFITLHDIEQGDSTILFYEGSHKNDASEELQCITCKAGSLVIWNTKLKHLLSKPERTRKNSNIKMFVNLTYFEKKYTNNVVIKKRIKAFENMKTTNNVPYDIVINNENEENVYIERHELEPIGYSLVGYEKIITEIN